MLDRAFVCAQCTARLSRRPILRSRISPLFSIPRRFNSHATPSDRPVRVAIVGSGPAGFYAASRLLSKQEDAVVDMYEKLPVPFGLARYGVAPDHPEVKVCAVPLRMTLYSAMDRVANAKLIPLIINVLELRRKIHRGRHVPAIQLCR